jgi:hypothetical protein
MRLASPSRGAPGSRLADWLELVALHAPRRAVGRGDLLSVLRPDDEDRGRRRTFDAEAAEFLEAEILGESFEDVSRLVHQELTRRGESLGDHYPFKLSSVGSLGRAMNLKALPPETPGAVGYLFCLIVSALRLNLLEPDEADENARNEEGLLLFSEHMFGKLFQVCAAAALGGYLQGEVVSFGHPRPDHTSFLPAHLTAWERFGAYKPVQTVPIGLSPSQKDAGIDLISWLNFPDGHAAKILVFGQVASGDDWVGKSVLDSARGLKSWFEGPVYENFIPLIAMPFNITDARAVIERGADVDIRAQIFEVEERAFGIVLDRDRIAISISKAFSLDQGRRECIDQLSAFANVSTWVKETLTRLG